MTMLASVGIVGGQKTVAVASSVTRVPQSMTGTAAERPTWPAGGPPAYVFVGGKGGGWGVQRPQETPEADSGKKERSLVDEIGEMTEGKDGAKQQEETVLKQRSEGDGPPNPKKRIYEQEKDESLQKKDEL
jgi:hypothetical protein